jgi:hypothetical protein
MAAPERVDAVIDSLSDSPDGAHEMRARKEYACSKGCVVDRRAVLNAMAGC